MIIPSQLPALLALLACLLFAPPAAGESSVTLGPEEFKAIFNDIVLESSPFPRKDIEIANFSSRPLSLALPAGGLDYRVTQRPADGSPGRKSVTVTFLTAGREAGQVRMSGDLRLFSEVVCTTRRLARNELIGQDDIAVLRQDISMLDNGLIRDPAQALGQKLKTSLPAGALLSAQHLDAPPLVRRGELVTITASSANVRITAPGEARNTGALGEVIKVKNLMSRREIHARIAGPGAVETEF